MPDPSIWNLRLNLDKLNGLNNRCRTDAERLQAFQGFLAGCNGAEPLEDDAPAFRRGWELGSATHEEAARYHQAQSERGRASAAKRMEKTGSAQPQKPTTVRTDLEPPFEPVFEPPLEPRFEPNLNPQSTKNKEQPPSPPAGGKRPPREAFTPPTMEQAQAYADEIGFRETVKWMDHYKANGWKVGAVRMVDWKACMRNWHSGRNAPPPRLSHQGPPGRPGVVWNGFQGADYAKDGETLRKDQNGTLLI